MNPGGAPGPLNRNEAQKELRHLERLLLAGPVTAELKCNYLMLGDLVERLERGELPQGVAQFNCPLCHNWYYAPADAPTVCGQCRGRRR